MTTASVCSSSGSRIAGDEIDMVSPVFDGNKVMIVVPFQRTAGGSREDGVDEKKVRVEVPIPRNLLIPSGRWNDHSRLLVQNHRNFKESGMPVRFMVFKDGSWRNFEKNIMGVLVSAFVSGKAMVEVEMEGRKLIFDFYRMLGIELDSGNELFISWIDISGKCFYSKLFIEGSENLDKNEENVNENFEDRKIELEIRIIEKNSSGEELGKRKRENEEDEVEKEVGSSSRRFVAMQTELLPPKWPRTRPMMDEECLYKKVKDVLCTVLRGGVTVTAVHQCTRTGPMEQARIEIFKKNVEMVGRARGDPRLEYAWYGTSSKNVESIMGRGFEMPRIVPGSHTHGVGIHLSPLCSPQNSDMMSELDENGEKHIILCRVIVGKVEKVELGSRQLFPSSADFDTGVDDLIYPKLHVVWCGNMNTHILPLYIVSYKSVRPMSGQLNGGAHAYTTLILLKIQCALLPPKKLEFQSLYRSHREGKVGKEIFMRQLQSLVGEELLGSIIQETRG